MADQENLKEQADEKKTEAKPAAAEEKTAKPAEETAAVDKKAPEGQADEKQTVEEQKPEEKKPTAPDWKDQYARVMADFDNFRKRTLRDREDLIKSATQDVLKSLLTTVDNLARALALDEVKSKKDDPFVKGVQMVYDGLIKTLADQGATPLDSLGEPFNADYHEALATLPSPDVEEGHIMNEVKRGWLLHGKLLRAAQVVVSAGKPA